MAIMIMAQTNFAQKQWKISISNNDNFWRQMNFPQPIKDGVERK